MSGHYRMHRGWQDHPVFRGETFSRRDAWVWLIENAAWKATACNAGGKTVALRRGQLCHSYRHLADAWGWSLGAVQRYLTRLETDTMIERIADGGRMVITVCNYELYQSTQRIDNGPPDTDDDTPPIRDRYATDTKKKEGKEGKKERETVEAEASTSAAEAPRVVPLPVVDPERVVWGQCLDWLALASGNPPDKLRPLMGRWVKTHGKAAVLHAIQATSRAPPVGDVVAYIAEALARETDRHARHQQRSSPSGPRTSGVVSYMQSRGFLDGDG